MFNKITTVALIFFAFIFTFTSAIVINPVINVPNTSTKWRAGGTYTVQWETTYNDRGEAVPIPDGVTGKILLGYLENHDIYNEHLNWELASGFALNQGSLKVTLPDDLPTRTSYIIVLMGNSGNASGEFTIQAAKDAKRRK